MFSESSGTRARRQQIPRTTSSMRAPASRSLSSVASSAASVSIRDTAKLPDPSSRATIASFNRSIRAASSASPPGPTGHGGQFLDLLLLLDAQQATVLNGVVVIA